MTITQLFRAFWRGWFGPMPVVGASYRFDEQDRSPFEQPHYAHVLDLRDDWVKYETVPGLPRSMKVGAFRFCYLVR